MTDKILYEGGGFRVTHDTLRTRRQTYSLRRIEYLSLHRSFIALAAPPAIGLLAFAALFWRYLFFGEQLFLLLIPTVVLVIAWHVGALRVRSLALRDSEQTTTFGPMWRLKAVRAAVEQAMKTQRGDADWEGVDPGEAA